MAYASLSDVREYLGGPPTTDNTLLTNLIPRAQGIINAYTQRVFEASGDTTRYFDAIEDVDHLRRTLYLGQNDLCAITTVTNGDSTVLTTSDYTTLPKNYTPYYALKIKLNSSNVWTYSTTPEDAISISGRWAYSVTAPDDIKHACIRLVVWLYRQKDASSLGDVGSISQSGVVVEPAALPSDVQLILIPYKRLA
jgi:hypothetical protein